MNKIIELLNYYHSLEHRFLSVDELRESKRLIVRELHKHGKLLGKQGKNDLDRALLNRDFAEDFKRRYSRS